MKAEEKNNQFKLQVNGGTRSDKDLDGEMICFYFNLMGRLESCGLYIDA